MPRNLNHFLTLNNDNVNTGALPNLFQEDLYHFTTPVAVLLPRAWETFTEDEQSLLKKILTSVKVDLNAVQILITPKVNGSLLQVYSPARVLIFGCETIDEVPMYQSTTAHGFRVVRADDLSELDDTRKKNLWAALRQVFGV